MIKKKVAQVIERTFKCYQKFSERKTLISDTLDSYISTNEK